MAEHHPEDAPLVGLPSFGTWSSIDEALRSGELTSQYAQVWADYQAEQGCTFTDGC